MDIGTLEDIQQVAAVLGKRRMVDVLNHARPRKNSSDPGEMPRNRVSLPQGLTVARILFGNSFPAAECMRILCWFDEPGLASLPKPVKTTLTGEVKAAWDKPLPPSKRAGSGLTV